MTSTSSIPMRPRILHAIAHLGFTAGRYVVDTAVEQHRREPGSVAVVVSEDAEGPWNSSAALAGELAAAGVALHRCGDFLRRDTAGLKAAAGAIATLGVADTPGLVVHAHTPMAAVAGRWAGAPTVVATCHEWTPDRVAEFGLQEVLAYSLCDRVIAPSAQCAGMVREKTAVTDVQVVPYGFDHQRVAPMARRARPFGRPTIVGAAGLSSHDGPDILLAAMARVWLTHPETELHFFGDGDRADATRAMARLLDASGTRVVFHDAGEDLSTRLAEFDVFAIASREDRHPAPIVEAMLAGLPIVAAGGAGTQELIGTARCGLGVPADSPREMAAALAILIDSGHEGRQELGAAGVRFGRATFDIHAHVMRLDAIYSGAPVADAQSVAAPALRFVADGPVKLHVGCGSERRDGWVNVDARASVQPDVVAPADALPMFADDSVDVIEACHLLEHLSVHEARRAVREWFRLLKHDGELLLELPNFDACVQLLGKHADAHGYDLAMVGIYGWPIDVEQGGVAQMHKWGWSPESLGALLKDAGFTDVRTVPITQTWRPAARIGRDFRMRAVKTVAKASAA